MAEPNLFSAPSSRPVRPRLPHALRDSRDETFDLSTPRRPGPRPARPALPHIERRTESHSGRRAVLDDTPATPHASPDADPEPPSPEARARAAEHASAERMLRAALLIGLLLNLAVFLGAGLAALPLGPLSRSDALLGAVTLAAAVGMLALGEICRDDEPPSFRR